MLSRLWLIISDSKALHMKSSVFMATASAAWGPCYAFIDNIIPGACEKERSRMRFDVAGELYGSCVLCVPSTRLGY